MKREWFFDRFCGEQVAVYAEDGKIVEVGVEHEQKSDVVGNIYKGRVANVVQGMQAAFIACGMERNGYLPLGEDATFLSDYDGKGGVEQTALLAEGDELLVQVVKAPRGNKGAKVSCNLSFVGKNLIYLPRTDFIGISRKITDEKTRAALLSEAEKYRRPGEGFIVRTAAATATKRHFKTESDYLKRIYQSVLKTAKSAPVGAAVYREYELPVKIMRDSLNEGVTKIYVGNEELYLKLLTLARLRSDMGEKKLVRYDGGKNLFSAYYRLDEQIYELANPRIRLANGAYLMIDRTEAMTVFDVNTGKYTGESDLESTVFETNLLAAREIARQVRLRNIGGIVAVDFIDMEEEPHRAAVGKELERALSEDRAKCRVLPMSELCVLLFTRKRTNRELASFLLQPCPHCTRQGYVLSDLYMAMRLRGAILETLGDNTAVTVSLNAELAERILSERYFEKECAGPWKNVRIYLLPRADLHKEQFEVHGEKSLILSLPDNAKLLY